MYIISDEHIVYDDKKGILYKSDNYKECEIYLDEMERVKKETEELDKNYKDFPNQTMLPDEKIMKYDEEIKKCKEVIYHSPTINESSKEIVDLIINNPTLPIFCSVQKDDNIKYGNFYNDYVEWRVQQTCGAKLKKVILYHDEILSDKENLEEKIYEELYNKYENIYNKEYNKDYYERDYHDFIEKLTNDIVKIYDKYWIDAIVIFINY